VTEAQVTSQNAGLAGSMH